MAAGADATISALNTNQFLVGTNTVYGTWVNGKFVGDALIGDSNQLFVIHTTISIPQKTSETETNNYSKRLELLFEMGEPNQNNGPAGAHGYHGDIYTYGGLNNLKIAQTNWVDILCSEDRSRIVMMVLDNGPIYASKDSGMTWQVFSKP